MPRTKRTAAKSTLDSSVNEWLAIIAAPPKEETPAHGFFMRSEIRAAAIARGSAIGWEALSKIIAAKMEAGEAEMRMYRRKVGKHTRSIPHYKLK